MAHINATHNTNNRYTVEIVVDPDASVNGLSSNVLIDNNGNPYYIVQITPNIGAATLQDGVYAGNFKVDGNAGQYHWDGVFNNTGDCFPPPSPHDVRSSFSRMHSYQNIQTSGCTDSLTSSNKSVQGPIKFSNSTYVNGTFTTDSVAVTWSEINLVEVYQRNSGQLVNSPITNGPDPVSGGGSVNSSHWQLDSNLNPNNLTNNSAPVRLDAIVKIVFDPNITITTDQVITIDFDEVLPIPGCTNPAASNYDSNNTVDDGTCSFSGPTYGVELQIDISDAPTITHNYTDGSTYSNGFGGNYTTVNFDQTTYVNGNISLSSTANLATNTIVSLNTYAVGAPVQEVHEFYIYPSSFTFASLVIFNLYDFPFAGGPAGNLSSYGSGFEQRMFWGWGDTKNNLTAASLRIQNPGTFNWHNPMYQDPANFSPVMSLWHYDKDITGLQPTETVSFNNFTTSTNVDITSSIQMVEEYDTAGTYAFQWFPEKVKVIIALDFVMPSGLAYNSNIVVPVKIYHDTENQGDLNW